MDTLNQSAPIQENPENNQMPNLPTKNSDYAEKGPLFTSRLKKKIFLTCGIFVVFFAILVAGLFAYQQLNKPPAVMPPPPKPEATNPEPVHSDTPRFAYIKNEKNIWISNIDGKEKYSILELPLTSTSTIISLGWKDKNNLSYTTCDSETSVCEISTYSFETKAIKPELTSTGSSITKFAWSKDNKYLAYMEIRNGVNNLRLKLGTIDTILKSFTADKDDTSLSKSTVAFNPDNQYIVYSAPELIVTRDPKTTQIISSQQTQSLYVYQLNGAQIDEVKNIIYPFFIDNDTVAYKSNNRLVYKDVGTTDVSAITDFTGYNPALSTNDKQIAYWRDEVGFNNVVLGVYESDRGIHRNILRGVILPIWVSDDKVVGIKADSCIGERCLLYEFQTTSMVIVDVNNGEVLSVDQGKSLTGVAFYAD
jgi:hypothetical protein